MNNFRYLEVGTVEAGLAEGFADGEFLADDGFTILANNLQLTDTTALAPFKRDEVNNLTQSLMKFALYEVRQFFLSIFHLPMEEIASLLVIVIENLR